MKPYFLVLLLALTGCAHSLHEVHVSDFLPRRSLEAAPIVKADAEQFVILGLVFDTDYVNVAYNKLQKACPKGAISGITTQYMTSLGFFSWTNKILMQGQCVTK